jgi:hypothetical protein
MHDAQAIGIGPLATPWSHRRAEARGCVRRRPSMSDLLLLGLTVGLFALGWLYVRALERL